MNRGRTLSCTLLTLAAQEGRRQRSFAWLKIGIGVAF
jgi:hypothetical protein